MLILTIFSYNSINDPKISTLYLINNLKRVLDQFDNYKKG